MAEQITLEFLARQIDRVLDRLGTMEDQAAVQTGMVIRPEGSLEGLTAEARGIYRLLNRME